MPEIWLNYGSTDVVLDIKAENLEQKIDVDGETLSDTEIKSKLESLDISKPTEFVVLNTCLLYTSPSPRDRSVSRMPSSA